MTKKRLETVGPLLKKYRKENKLSVTQVSVMLQEQCGRKVAPKTIYGWENGVSHMSVSEFLTLCSIYEIKDLTIFWEKEEQKEKKLPIPEKDQLYQTYQTSEYKVAIDHLLNK